MAWMNQERKAALKPQIDAVLAKYGLKGSLSVHNHSTLVLKIKSGRVNFHGDQMLRLDLHGAIGAVAKDEPIVTNPYWLQDHFGNESKNALIELRDAMNGVGAPVEHQNHNRSDIMSDYFDVGWYIEIRIGEWNKPYKLV